MKIINNDIERLKSVKELIITIDMINGFVKEGNLAAPSIMRIVPRQIEILNRNLNSTNTGIIFIRDSHPKDASEFKTYGKHCIEGTKETELIDELKIFEPYALEYLKNSTNLMFAPGFRDDLLKFYRLEKIRLMGCLSEVCVLNGAIGLKTFLDQMNMNTEVCVYRDAIDTYDSQGHNADMVNEEALKLMKSNGIKILGRRR